MHIFFMHYMLYSIENYLYYIYNNKVQWVPTHSTVCVGQITHLWYHFPLIGLLVSQFNIKLLVYEELLSLGNRGHKFNETNV